MNANTFTKFTHTVTCWQLNTFKHNHSSTDQRILMWLSFTSLNSYEYVVEILQLSQFQQNPFSFFSLKVINIILISFLLILLGFLDIFSANFNNRSNLEIASRKWKLFQNNGGKIGGESGQRYKWLMMIGFLKQVMKMQLWAHNWKPH